MFMLAMASTLATVPGQDFGFRALDADVCLFSAVYLWVYFYSRGCETSLWFPLIDSAA